MTRGKMTRRCEIGGDFCKIGFLLVAVFAVLLVPLPARADIPEPRCVFVEGPDVRPTVKGESDVLSECPCYITGMVKNVGMAPAFYVNVIVTFWDEQTGDLVDVAWNQVSGGMLQPGEEKFVRFGLRLPDVESTAYDRKVDLRWKDEECRNGQIDCAIESTFTNYGADSSAFLCGFIKNIDSEAGFAPILKARLLDESGKTANIVIAGIPRIPMEPGETLPFALTIPAVSPSDTVSLSMERA